MHLYFTIVIYILVFLLGRPIYPTSLHLFINLYNLNIKKTLIDDAKKVTKTFIRQNYYPSQFVNDRFHVSGLRVS